MSKYLTGSNRGDEIMTECVKGHWADRNNNIFIDLEKAFSDSEENPDTFSVSERLRGNTHVVWAKGLEFEDALILAERLTIGKDYLPPRRPTQVSVEPEFEVGEILPGDFHGHQINDPYLAHFYKVDVENITEVPDFMIPAYVEQLMGANNKQAKVFGISEGNNLLIGYHYDFTYFTGILVRRKK